MWLLDTKDLSLKQVPERYLETEDDATGPTEGYGILSHRWESDDQEPTFEEFHSGQPLRDKKGVLKIEDCCRLAQGCSLDLLWSDTCCIDRKSSAELQEAINSMYRYYKRAAICFAYLRDVEMGTFNDTFTKSEWFTRGWTLQELLAPNDLRFYDREWKYLGNKHQLAHELSDATGVPIDVLTGKIEVGDCSVAQRMSWAAKRRTSRVEDRVYSLLGIFNVHMPMLYGEGSMAFLRLQEEIIKSWDDPTLFAWRGLKRGYPGLLAPTPDGFATCGDVRIIQDRKQRHSYTLNNRGLCVKMLLTPYTLDTYLMLLSCGFTGLQVSSKRPARIGIFLRRLYEDDQYMRVSVFGEEMMENATDWLLRRGQTRVSGEHTINVRQRSLLTSDLIDVDRERVQGFRLNQGLLAYDRESEPLFHVDGSWDPQSRIVSLPPGSNRAHYVGSINIGPQKRDIEMIRFGFDADWNPVVFLSRRGVHYTEYHDVPRGVFIQEFNDDLQNTTNFNSEKSPDALPWSGGYSWYDDNSKTQDMRMTQTVPGLWALRGDRLDGLNVRIVESEPPGGNRISRRHKRNRGFLTIESCHSPRGTFLGSTPRRARALVRNAATQDLPRLQGNVSSLFGSVGGSLISW